MMFREAAKKGLFLVALLLRPLRPSSLVGTKKFPEFFLELQKTFFFLIVKPLKIPNMAVRADRVKVPGPEMKMFNVIVDLKFLFKLKVIVKRYISSY